MIITQLVKYWWLLLIRGVFAIIFGLLALLSPVTTLAFLVILFGAYVFADGVFSLIAAFRARKEHEYWWILLLQGILGIAVGLLALYRPDVTALLLVLYIAFWIIITGILEIVIAIRLAKEIKGEGWYIAGGVLSVLAGILFFVSPLSGAVIITWLLGIYAIIFGVFFVFASFKLKKIQP